MIFTVIYNSRNEDVWYRIDSYNITEPEIYIPKFLLLKLADLSNKKSKFELMNNESLVLKMLIEGFKYVGILENNSDETCIWKIINDYLLSANMDCMINLYNKMTELDNAGYAPFQVVQEVD